ncbi:YcjF family protein [uncultured Bradyrhizobium sp.]|uniref:YcjF family protein n=1 Tax=uncultured Bradyrhizobium sp. TaxID=199684 RepID=UPI0035CC0F9A
MAEHAHEDYSRHERHDRHNRDEPWRHDRDDDWWPAHRHERESADEIVKDYALWAGGFGLVPFPLIDVAAITATQVRMVSELNKHYRRCYPERYHYRFSHERMRAIIASLIGSSIPVAAGTGISSMLKGIPVIGQVLGLVTTPVFAWASTKAVGRVFIEHFESGGTLLDFDPEKMRHYYYKQFEAAKRGGRGREDREETVNAPPAATTPPRTGKA